MKYLRQENNRFIFGGLYDNGELALVAQKDVYSFKGVVIRDDMKIAANVSWIDLKDIQTAVQMMTILKDEGLV